MPNAIDTDGLEQLIRSFAEQLTQPAIRRAEATLEVADVDALVARFEPAEIERSTHIYPADTFGEDAPSAIDAVRIVIERVQFHIGQSSREPTATELDVLNAAATEHPAVTMPNGGSDAE